MSTSPRRDPAAVSAAPPAQVDLGDLAVAQVVHDLRNAFLVLAGSAEYLSDFVPAGPGQERLIDLREQAAQNAAVAAQLLTAHALRRDRHPVDLNHVVTRCRATLAVTIARSHQLQVRLANEPLRVSARSGEIERILLNLVLNARDAMPGLGLVTIETAIERGFARLTVTDTGSGIAPHVQTRIFEPFFTTRGGPGLGLTSVAYTVQQLNGSVSMMPRTPGTSVRVLLPLASGPPTPFL